MLRWRNLRNAHYYLMYSIKFSELPFTTNSGEHMGVYKISFDNNYFYIGSSSLLRHRLSQWKMRIRKNTVKNKNIKSILSISEYVSFEIIEEIGNKNKLKEREDFYIKKYWGQPLFLNRCPSAFNNAGLKLTKGEKADLLKNHLKAKHHIYTESDRIKNIERSIKNGVCKQVAKFDLDGNLICTHYSINDAAKSIGVRAKVITLLFKGEQITTKGHIFKRIDSNGNIIENINLNRKRGREKGSKYTDNQRLSAIKRFKLLTENGFRLVGPIKAKKIIVLDINSNIINKFDSITKAAKDLGIESGNICSVLKGNRKTCNGYIFKYA